jgi:hypothetical protein
VLFPVPRQKIFRDVRTLDGLSNYRSGTLEDFWEYARDGKKITFFDHRRLLMENDLLGAGSSPSQSVLTLPQTPASDLFNGSDIFCFEGSGKGRRRRIASNEGQTLEMASNWGADGQQPKEGSEVGLLLPSRRGVFDEKSASSLPAERADTASEFFYVTIGLLIG